MKQTLKILAALALTACSPKPDMPLQTRLPEAQAEGSRVTVERIGIFTDELAYGSRRAVYVIRDKATGQEFIGVSGIGIAETGRHQSGKSRASDER